MLGVFRNINRLENNLDNKLRFKARKDQFGGVYSLVFLGVNDASAQRGRGSYDIRKLFPSRFSRLLIYEERNFPHNLLQKRAVLYFRTGYQICVCNYWDKFTVCWKFYWEWVSRLFIGCKYILESCFYYLLDFYTHEKVFGSAHRPNLESFRLLSG